MEILIVLILILLHWYLEPNFDMDDKSDSLFIHYNWRGIRKTFKIKL